MGDSCKDCKFVEAQATGSFPAYFCRRFPPQPEPLGAPGKYSGSRVEYVARFPRVMDFMWCGEFVASE